MKEILIDGSFLGKKITGVQRFNWETLRRLAQIPDLKIYVAVPRDISLDHFDIPGVEFVREGKKNNKFWQLITLGRIARKRKLPLLCMSNFSPLFRKDYVVLHDVTYLDKEGRNDRFWAWIYRVLIGFRFHRHRLIFTVSEFSRSRILYHYPKVKKEQVVVVGNGGDHWRDVGVKKPDMEHLDAYYLAVGSTSANKNFGYIIRLAERNPDKQFLVVGRIDGPWRERSEGVPNMTFTGYLQNEELKYLYLHTKGMIQPSFYEGFGLPALEALNCGCRILALADIPTFREVYAPVANFFDPYDEEHLVDLDALRPASEEAAEKILSTYNWENVAATIYAHVEEKK